MQNKEKIDALVSMEWNQFHNVQNEGGQASCQRDDETFYIMRSSQFSVWTEAMLDSYKLDLAEAAFYGRNLPAEKYAWMEAETAPKKFEEIKHLLQEPTPRALEIIEKATAIQTDMMAEYAEKYPAVASGNRAVRAKDAGPFQTSFETYTRGELHTYSERTLIMYMENLNGFVERGENMVMQIMQETVKQYGYADLDECEAATRKRYQ